MEMKEVVKQDREEIYHDPKEAVMMARLYAFEALNYARLFSVRESDLKDIHAFNTFIGTLDQLSFSKMIFSCQSVKNTCVFQIKISVLVDKEWLETSYICKALPVKTI